MNVIPTILVSALGIAVPVAAAAQTALTAVPPTLEVPAGHQAFLVLHAEGTQNYVCAATPGGFAWTFFGPQATLFDTSGQQQLTHFPSPNPDEDGATRATWQHAFDTSAVWAAPIASSTDPAFVTPGAIPWLLLRVVGTRPGPTGGQTMVGTTYVQRVDTAGGIAPVTGCRSTPDAGTRALVPYSTDYVFYK